MTDIGAADLLRTVKVVDSAIGKEVEKMIEEAGRHNNSGGTRKASRLKLVQDGNNEEAEFSDLYEESPGRRQDASKAPACYQATLERMEELGRLQKMVDYHAKLKESGWERAVERARGIINSASMLGPLRWLISEPVPPLEKLVAQEIDVMAAMQKQVGMAVQYSEGIVRDLHAFDEELLRDFNNAKTGLGTLEKRLAKAREGIGAKTEQLSQTPMTEPVYVPLQSELNNLVRVEKDTLNTLEITGQQVLDTYKQGSQVRAKEDVVRKGLHELKLVHSYATRFLNFVQRTRQADDLLPQLVETATAVTDAYAILTRIVQTGNAATTDAVKKLVEVIGTVDYRMMPTVQREVNRQRSMLERADKKTTFYEQAVELLTGKDYQPVNTQKPAADPPASGISATQHVSPSGQSSTVWSN